MGSVIEYTCKSCSFSSGHLEIGYGKAGRGAYWAGLARCEPCSLLGVADITRRRTHDPDLRCGACNGPIILLEGTADVVACPRCHRPLRHATIGTWN